MRFTSYALAAILSVSCAGLSCAAPATAAAYSTSTSTIGTLMGNPATKAILVKYIPDIVNSGQISLANGMTLKGIQSYAGDALNDDVLAKIDSELTKLKK